MERRIVQRVVPRGQFGAVRRWYRAAAGLVPADCLLYNVSLTPAATVPFMKLTGSLVALVLITVTVIAFPAHAQDFRRNAWGVYLAPTTFGIAEGTKFQLANSRGALDLGAYYARAFTPGFSGRLELRLDGRGIDDLEWNESIGGYDYFRLSETILEIPLLLQGDKRIPISNHEVRVSVGGGGAYKYVLDQKLLVPSGEISSLVAADSYQKVSLLLDGGVTFEVQRASAVFLRMRYDIDLATFGEPAQADVIRRFVSAGFYAGFEYGI